MISATLSTVTAPVAWRNVAAVCLTAKSSITKLARISPLYGCNPVYERTSWKTAFFRQSPQSLNWYCVKDSKSRSSSASVLNAVGNGGEILHDLGATALVMAGAYALVFVFDYLTQRSFIEQNLSRKLVHILSGLLFMVSWPIFSTATEARYFASLVPLVNCLRLVYYGLALANDEGLIKSVTREGKAEELLRGPLYYVLVLIASVLFFWRDSPIGVISLAMMCGGDGIADIMGRRFGTLKLPYNRNKSLAGSLSMFFFGFLVSIGMLFYFSSYGYFELDWIWATERVALISLVATIVESLPTAGRMDDNISVPLSSMLVGILCFRGI